MDGNNSFAMSETTVKRPGGSGAIQLNYSGYSQGQDTSRFTQNEGDEFYRVDEIDENMSIQLEQSDDELDISIEDMRKAKLAKKPRSLDDFDGKDKCQSNDRATFAHFIQQYRLPGKLPAGFALKQPLVEIPGRNIIEEEKEEHSPTILA